MRKLAITLAAAGATLGLSAPASAQFYPQRAYGYGYVAPHYGYNAGAIVQHLDLRIAGIRSHIRAMAARGTSATAALGRSTARR